MLYEWNQEAAVFRGDHTQYLQVIYIYDTRINNFVGSCRHQMVRANYWQTSSTTASRDVTTAASTACVWTVATMRRFQVQHTQKNVQHVLWVCVCVWGSCVAGFIDLTLTPPVQSVCRPHRAQNSVSNFSTNGHRLSGCPIQGFVWRFNVPFSETNGSRFGGLSKCAKRLAGKKDVCGTRERESLTVTVTYR